MLSIKESFEGCKEQSDSKILESAKASLHFKDIKYFIPIVREIPNQIYNYQILIIKDYKDKTPTCKSFPLKRYEADRNCIEHLLTHFFQMKMSRLGLEE